MKSFSITMNPITIQEPQAQSLLLTMTRVLGNNICSTHSSDHQINQADHYSCLLTSSKGCRASSISTNQMLTENWDAYQGWLEAYKQAFTIMRVPIKFSKGLITLQQKALPLATYLPTKIFLTPLPAAIFMIICITQTKIWKWWPEHNWGGE